MSHPGIILKLFYSLFRTLELKEFIEESDYLIDNLQDRVTQTLNSQKYPNLTDSFNLELHQILNPLRSIVHKIEVGYMNVDKFLKMREESDKTISKYIDIVSKTPEFGEGADDVILLQKHIISNQRNLIAQLLIPNFPILESNNNNNNIISDNSNNNNINNIEKTMRRPSIDSRYRSKSVTSHLSYSDEESELLYLPMNLKIATMLQQYEEDLTASFLRELEIRKEENRILHEELEKKYPIVKPAMEPNEMYKKRINELEIIIDQLKVENLELQSDSNYLIMNSNHILIPYEEKSRLNSINTTATNNNSNLNHSNYILFDTLETIKNDLSIIHKELNRIIKMKNNYITTIESSKCEEYNKAISVVNDLVNNNNNNSDSNNNPAGCSSSSNPIPTPLISPKRNKILSESLKKCSELIRNVGDITSDYKKMKDKIKDEMREEMKEKYLLMNKQKTLQYKKLEEENNKLREMLKLRENELELVERENERLKMMKEDVLSHLMRQLTNNNNNNGIDKRNNNNHLTDYIQSKYSIKRKECLLKDITIQYLKSIINKQKQVSNLSNVQVVSLIHEFNQIKTQYEQLLYNDLNDDNVVITNNYNNSINNNSNNNISPPRNRVFSLSFPPTNTPSSSSSISSPFSPSHLHNNNITPLCFHQSLVFGNNNNNGNFNFSFNNNNYYNTPQSCRSTSSSSDSNIIPLSPSVPTIYTKWSKKISELEDLLEDKNEEINNLQLINLKNQKRINELEMEYRNKEIISINLQNQLNHMFENEKMHNVMKYNLEIINYGRVDLECKYFTLSSVILDNNKIGRNKNKKDDNDKSDDDDDDTVYTHESERYKEDLVIKDYNYISIIANKPFDIVNHLNDFELKRMNEVIKRCECDINLYEYFLRKMFVLSVSLFLMVIYV